MSVQKKDAIKRRMQKNAISYWGASESEFAAFDPVVGLLLEAYAHELYKVSHEIENSRTRVLEHAAQLLIPEVYSSPQPAHAILYGRATESTLAVNHQIQLYNNRKKSITSGEIQQDIYWAPNGNFLASDAVVRYIASPSFLYEMQEDLFKETLYPSTRSNQSEKSIWIGIEAEDETLLQGPVQFYIDWKGLPDQNTYYQMLSSVKCSYRNQSIPCRNVSHFSESAGEHKKDGEMLHESPDTNIRQLYAQRFLAVDLSIAGKNKAGKSQLVKEDLPELLRAQFTEAYSLGRLHNVIWLKFDFPPAYPTQALDECSFLLNCFPVVNKRFCRMRYNLKEQINIIPLEIDNGEVFLSIHNVTGHEGKKYKQATTQKNTTEGTFILRHNGVQRFDRRSAQELLQYVSELVLDESATFAAFGREYVTSIIKDLSQNIAALQQRLKTADIRQKNIVYLFVKPIKAGDAITIEYWTTNGEDANGLRPGTRLQLFSGASFYPGELQFITMTNGGRGQLSQDEMVESYKYALLARGRIVSQEDLKAACLYYFSNKIKDINISRGVISGILPGQGLMPVTDIAVQVADNNALNEEEWQQQGQDLLLRIKSQSLPDVNYRLKIQLPENQLIIH